MDTQKTLIALQESFAKLQADFSQLSAQVYKNNFSSTQTFNKDSVFSAGLRVPVYDSAPTVAEEGYIAYIGGKLYVCTSTSPVTWTIVGTQS